MLSCIKKILLGFFPMGKSVSYRGCFVLCHWDFSLGFDQVGSLPHLSCFVKGLHHSSISRAIACPHLSCKPSSLPWSACFTATASNLSNHLTLQSGRRNGQEGERIRRNESCGAQINFKTTYQVIRHMGHKGTVNLLCKGRSG